MICRWDKLLEILPQHYRMEVDRLGRGIAQELRLRRNQKAQMVTAKGCIHLSVTVTQQDISQIIQFSCRYSPWSSASSAKGFVTAPGAHRVGFAGEAVIKDGQVTGFREITSLCIRIAADFPGIGEKATNLEGNLLILGPPGWGKTTLLRDVARQIANREGETVCVVDQREELFPFADGGFCFPLGQHMDVLRGCDKATGLEIALRSMSPTCIAVDEVTANEDCISLLQACWCGVRILATVHASSVRDLLHRELYRPLVETGLFSRALILQKDKSWVIERVVIS